MSELDAITKLVRTRLLGESLREIGVLVFVFGALDILLEAKGAISWPIFCAWSYCIEGRYIALVFFAVAGIFLLYYGIKIEAEAELALEEIEKERLGKETENDIRNGSV